MNLTLLLFSLLILLTLSSARSRLVGLDRLQYDALRIASGCMRTTPISILLSEANEPTLELRRSLFLNRNSIRIASWADNPLLHKIGGHFGRDGSEKADFKVSLGFSSVQMFESYF